MWQSVRIFACCALVACSSSSKNEAQAAGGSGGGPGGSGGGGGSTGGSAGSTGGSAGSTGGSAGSTGGSAGSTGGSAGSTGGGGTGAVPTCAFDSTDDSFDCAPHAPTSMGVDSTAIYWALGDGTGEQYLFRVLKSSTAASVAAWAKIGTVSAVGDIVSDGSNVYVSTPSPDRQLIRFPVASPVPTVLVGASDCSLPFPRAPLAIDSNGVYFACNASSDFVGVWSGSGATIVFTYPSAVLISGLASNGATLAVAMDDLDKIPLPSGPAGLMKASGGYTRVGMVGQVVYAQGASAVTKHYLGGAADEDVLTAVPGIIDFRVDDTGLYAILPDKVIGKLLTAVGHKEIATSVTPSGIALDSKNVYWTTAAGKVQRAAR